MNRSARKPVLDVRGLTAVLHSRRGDLPVVTDVSWSVSPGQTLGIVGESGSGKTIATRALLRMLPVRGTVTGSVDLVGTSLFDLDKRQLRTVLAEHVGLIPQNPLTALNPRLTVGAQLREALDPVTRRSRQRAIDRSIELLDAVGVADGRRRLGAYPFELSGGIAQRVLIAMAIARRPKVLIADEPTTALDVGTQAQILDLIGQLQRDYGLAVVLISHDVGVIAERADDVAVMYGGRIVERGPRDHVLTTPSHPYPAALLASAPAAHATSATLLPVIGGTPPDPANLPAGCPFAPRCVRADQTCHTSLPGETTVDGRGYRCWHPLPDGVATADVPPPTTAPADVPPPADAPARTGDPTSEAGQAGDVLVEVDGVTKGFRLRTGFPPARLLALTGISLRIRAGAALGIVGESGSGKTTLARILVGLENPDGGTVRRSGAGGDVQMIFQDPYSSLHPLLSVGDNIAEALRIRQPGMGRAERAATVDALLADVGLTSDYARRRPRQLSGGQLQRVSIARALAARPRLLVADEPVSALDLSVQAAVLNLLRTLRETRNLGYVIVSHDLAVIRFLCEEVAVVYLGAVVESGRTAQVYDSPAHPYTAGLINAIPGRGGQALRGEIPSPVDRPPGCGFAPRCPLAQRRCRTETPQLSTVDGSGDGESGRQVACHFPLLTSSLQATGGTR